MTDSVHYYPDGKGGFIGVKGSSSPAAGETLTHNMNGLGVVGGSPVVGDPIVYSPDGRGGFVGAVNKNERLCLWYWKADGTDPKTWVPYGTHIPTWTKIKIHCNHAWGRPVLQVDKTDIPHVFWWEAVYSPEWIIKLRHIWLKTDQELEDDREEAIEQGLPPEQVSLWNSELNQVPGNYNNYLSNWHYRWDVKIGNDGVAGSIHVVGMTRSTPGDKWTMFYMKKPDSSPTWATTEFPWTETGVNASSTITGVSLALDPWGYPHIAFTDLNYPYEPSAGTVGAIAEYVRTWAGWLYYYVCPFRKQYLWYDTTHYQHYPPVIQIRPMSTLRDISTIMAFGGPNISPFYDLYCLKFYEKLGDGVGTNWTNVNPGYYDETIDPFRRSVCSSIEGETVTMATSLNYLRDKPPYPVYPGTILEYQMWSGGMGYNPMHTGEIPRMDTADIPQVAGPGFEGSERVVQILHKLEGGSLCYDYFDRLDAAGIYQFHGLASNVGFYSLYAAKTDYRAHLIFIKDL